MADGPGSAIWGFLRKHPLGAFFGVVLTLIVGFCAAFNTFTEFRKNMTEVAPSISKTLKEAFATPVPTPTPKPKFTNPANKL